MTSECYLCCDIYTATKRFEIKCAKCEQSCCSDCFKNYFLKGDELQLNCPFDCGHTYDPSQIHKINKSNMSFFKKLLERLTTTNIIYEESLLAGTQAAARHQKKWMEFSELRKKEREEIAKLKALIRAKNDNIWRIETELYRQQGDINKGVTIEYTFVKDCAHEGCRGKLNTQWKCTMCEEYTCSKCHSPKNGRDDPDHVCDEDVVKNLEALKQESKACPNCGTGISKIDGCDQMYCITCHTAFSWRTGKIETGYIHNPEYFRYRRDHGLDIARNPADRPGEIDDCFDPFGNADNRRYFDHIIRSHKYLTGNTKSKLFEIYRFAVHLTNVDIHHYDDVSEAKKKELRIKYLLSQIDKDKWHTRLKKIIKEGYFHKEIRDLLVTLRDIIKDIIVMMLREFVQGDKENHNDLALDLIRHFVFWLNKQNYALHDCAKSYGSKKYFHYIYRYGRFINSYEEITEIKDY